METIMKRKVQQYRVYLEILLVVFFLYLLHGFSLFSTTLPPPSPPKKIPFCSNGNLMHPSSFLRPYPTALMILGGKVIYAFVVGAWV